MQVIEPLKGKKKLVEYFDENTKKVLLFFWHGLGDTVQFLVVLEKLKELYPKIHFDLALAKGLGQEDVYPEALLVEGDETKDFSGERFKNFDIVCRTNFPMNEGQTKYTKGEWCCIHEMGIDPVWGHLAPKNIKNRLVGVHFQITCLPDSANVPEEVATKVWNEIKEAGYIPIETLMTHVFHNPVNKKYACVNRDVRDAVPTVASLGGLIKNCTAFICCVSGNFHMALSLLPYERVMLLEKDFLAPSFTKHPIARANVKDYKDGTVKNWLLNLDRPKNTGKIPKSVFVLEDLPDRQAGFLQKFKDWETVVVKATVKESIDALQTRRFDLICLDHDLAGGAFVDVNSEISGCRVAEYIAGAFVDSKIIVHSLNKGGAEAIKKILPQAELKPFYWQEK